MTSDNRNTIIFVVCAAVGLLAYQALVLDPAARKRSAEIQQQKAAAAQIQRNNVSALNGIQPVGPDGRPAPLTLPRAQAKAASPRIAVETPALTGSVSLKGGRIDDLLLKNYRVTVDPKSPAVELLRPEGAQNAWFADFGWAGATPAGLPSPTTVWTQTAGGVLAPNAPVALTWDNGAGLRFTRRISVDDRFMFTVVDSVANVGAAPVALAPYASIQRQGLPADLGKNGVVHEGAIGAMGEEKNPAAFEDRILKYKAWKKDGSKSYVSDGGWLGITDKYWLAALIPDSKARMTGQYRVTNVSGVDIYDTNFVGQLTTVAPGATISQTTRLFAGAKSVPVLRDYEKAFNIPRFDSAIDWGMFWFFTRPIFQVLDFFFKYFGNFGVAILLLTVTVKLLFFPLANKSYESITKMKKVQPQVEALRQQYKDDPQTQQKELMGLYAKEKINPLTGCLPMLIQIPVFYALYKVLSVTIEMRHAPFVGFINDLSARDPSSLWNLFGALPYDPALIPLLGGILNGPLHVGLLGIAYGGTMWLTTAMNPPAADPMQQKIFQWMPLIFTFTLAQVAVGLMIYWAWNNVLSIIQQYIIMRRFKVENPIDNLIGKLTGKAKPKAAGVSTPEPLFTDEAIEQARILFARRAEFMMGAVKMEGLPDPDLPEVAFAGRSNVGKSSLINGLVGQNHLARASNEPGRTREVNFFVLDEVLRLVDLPGYGFARAGKQIKSDFQNLGRAYLRGRPNLKRVYLLIDARHGLKKVDAEALDALDLAAVSYQIVLTKADKMKPHEVDKVVEQTLKAISKRPAAFPRVVATSSEKGTGMPLLRAEIALATGAQPRATPGASA